MNNIERNEAIAVAQNALDDRDQKKRFIIDDETTSSLPFGWIFHGVSRKYLATKNMNDAIPAFGPIVVDKKGHVKFYPPIISDAAAAADYAKIWNAGE